MNTVKRLYKIAVDFLTSAAQHRVGPYAAQATFFIILSIIPFAMFLLSIIHSVLPYFLSISEIDVIEQVNNMFSDKIALVLEDMIRDVFDKSSGLSIITAVTALWFASRGMMAIAQGVNNVLSDGELRNYFVIRAVSVIYMFVFVLLIVVTMVLYGLGSHSVMYLERTFPHLIGTISRMIRSRSIILFILLTFFFALFYKVMPKRKMKFISLIPGAASAAAGWLVFTKGFTVYVKLSRSYSSIYGGMSYIVLGLLWLYFCINIMLMGAELNYMLKNRSGNNK